jgi:alkaline phosphatase D
MVPTRLPDSRTKPPERVFSKCLDIMQNTLSRRTFLRSSAALAAWSLLPTPNWGAVLKSPKLKAYPFACGIASGDPTPSGIVLWTRLAPDPLHGGGMPHDDVAVSWMIADDERMTKVVHKGIAVASADLAHSVHF